jgi:cytochrome c oxidase assembly protein subunit 15
LDPRAISQLHTDAVFLLVGLSVAMWFALRAASAPRPAIRAAAILVAVELGQGVIGFVQYFTHLPELLVGLHMFGACLVWLATLDTLHHTRSAPLSAALPPLARPAQSAPPAPPGPSAQPAPPAPSGPTAQPAPPDEPALPDEPAAPAQPVPSAQPAESVPASLRT